MKTFEDGRSGLSNDGDPARGFDISALQSREVDTAVDRRPGIVASVPAGDAARRRTVHQCSGGATKDRERTHAASGHVVRVDTLFEGLLTPGVHEVPFENDWPSGVYFLQAEQGAEVSVRRITRMR